MMRPVARLIGAPPPGQAACLASRGPALQAPPGVREGIPACPACSERRWGSSVHRGTGFRRGSAPACRPCPSLRAAEGGAGRQGLSRTPSPSRLRLEAFRLCAPSPGRQALWPSGPWYWGVPWAWAGRRTDRRRLVGLPRPRRLTLARGREAVNAAEGPSSRGRALRTAVVPPSWRAIRLDDEQQEGEEHDDGDAEHCCVGDGRAEDDRPRGACRPRGSRLSHRAAD